MRPTGSEERRPTNSTEEYPNASKTEKGLIELDFVDEEWLLYRLSYPSADFLFSSSLFPLSEPF
jgi:hypothetical protein